MSKTDIKRELKFENEQVKVWKTVVSPHQPLDIHPGGQVVIGLDTHQAYWLNPEDSKGKNKLDPGSEPVEIMVVEMKRVQERPLPCKPLD
ncbi:MAG: hypothetical protein S4CHLAM2_08470 [Chlamydiales bacterium]|nr:hypothetical protein [Chlamydiales bacterium]